MAVVTSFLKDITTTQIKRKLGKGLMQWMFSIVILPPDHESEVRIGPSRHNFILTAKNGRKITTMQNKIHIPIK